MFKLELGEYIILSNHRKEHSIDKSSIPNEGVELIFEGLATNITYDLYKKYFVIVVDLH